MKMMDHGIARAKEVLAAAGASNIAVESPILNGGWHLLGTARMGTDPERSVVNEWGRCHDVKNLFIVDGSIWVTSGRRQPDLDHPGAGALHRRQHQAAPRQSVRLRTIYMPNHDLTAEQVRDLRALAGMIIPPSAAYDVPGADDDKIFADILRSLERDRDDICRALAHLATLAGGAFADLEPERRAEVAAAFREAGGAPLAALGPRGAALLLPRRPGDALARPGAAPAFSEGTRRRAGRLVAARSGPRPAADVPDGRGARDQAGRRPDDRSSAVSTLPGAGSHCAAQLVTARVTDNMAAARILRRIAAVVVICCGCCC